LTQGASEVNSGLITDFTCVLCQIGGHVYIYPISSCPKETIWQVKSIVRAPFGNLSSCEISGGWYYSQGSRNTSK